jgi:aminobenzoyl-glutamate utilization protein B
VDGFERHHLQDQQVERPLGQVGFRRGHDASGFYISQIAAARQIVAGPAWSSSAGMAAMTVVSGFPRYNPRMPRTGLIALMMAAALVAVPLAQKPAPTFVPSKPSAAKPSAATAKLDALKKEAVADVESRGQFSQQMVDQIFSYGELGFQEFETNRYLIDILKKNGFAVQEGIAGIPTSFMATWGSGKPVIALGSDIDCIPQASQKPGVAWHDPIIEGAPGHGEGHNSGQAVNITAALAVKKIMEREHLSGTIRIWPGTAEELVGSKAYYIRAGLFKDVDIALFTHVGSELAVSWGNRSGTGLVSVQYSFLGETAHAAGNPWRGRSALDAVELMDIGWNFRREHLRLSQRSHNVIVDGGDQPNVVPAHRVGLVLLPRDRLRAHQGDVGDRRHDRQGGRHDGRRRAAADKVLGSAWPAALQQGRRRDRVGQHPAGGSAAVVGRRPAARQGAAEGIEEPARRRGCA